MAEKTSRSRSWTDYSYLETKTSNRLTDRTWEASITSSLKRLRFVWVQDEQWSFDESEQVWTSSHWTSFQDLFPERIQCINWFWLRSKMNLTYDLVLAWERPHLEYSSAGLPFELIPRVKVNFCSGKMLIGTFRTELSNSELGLKQVVLFCKTHHLHFVSYCEKACEKA